VRSAVTAADLDGNKRTARIMMTGALI